MALIGDEDSRPGLIGYEERNKPLYSEVEEETIDRITREFEQKKRETVLDLTMNQIIEKLKSMGPSYLMKPKLSYFSFLVQNPSVPYFY